MKHFPFILTLILISVSLVEPLHAADQKLLRQRFEQGLKLYEDGKHQEALVIFKDNLSIDPHARGSLLMTALCYNNLGKWTDAIVHFEKFLEFEPRHESGLIGAVKAHQALGNSKRAGQLRSRLILIKGTGGSQRMKLMGSFEREVLSLNDGKFISIQENFSREEFDPLWRYLYIEGTENVLREFELVKAPKEQAKALKATSPKNADKDLYLLGEHLPLEEGKEVRDYKIRALFWGRPTYEDSRQRMLKELFPDGVPHAEK